MSDTAMGNEQAGGGGGLLNYLPTIFWQRRWLVVIPFVLLSAAGIAAAYMLPSVYLSSATLLVESQDLPSSVVRIPEKSLIDQRIAKIRTQALSRGNLIELIQQNNLYPEERQSNPLSTVIEKMRAAMVIEAVIANVGQDNANTIAFSMSFRYHEPQPAQLVVQEYVRRFLDLDSSQTSEQAKSTVEFLTRQSDEIQRQIVQIEQQITGIKAQNGGMLTGGYPVMVNTGGYDAQIAALRRDNAILARQTPASAKDPVVAAIEAQLIGARATYSDSHPDVIILERRLEQARRAAGSGSPTGGIDPMLASQIAANNAQIAALERARDTDLSQAAAARGVQAQGPVLMERIAQMESRADTLRSQHRSIAENLLTARTAARMDEEQRGERLALIEAPVVPDRPISPNRPLIISGAIAAGLLAGLGLALAVELVLRPIRGPREIERLTGAPPLGVIPVFKDQPRRGAGKRASKRSLMPWRRAA